MNFDQIVNSRYSCRSYDKERKISRETIEQIIDSARLSPSACNSQPWKFVVVDDESLIEPIAKATQSALLPINKFTADASAFVVIVKQVKPMSDKVKQIMSHRDYTPYDIGIASATICYKATELGVGSCILGWYNGEKIQDILNIPKDKSVELVIALGYPKSDEIPPKKRKDKEQALSYNGYGE